MWQWHSSAERAPSPPLPRHPQGSEKCRNYSQFILGGSEIATPSKGSRFVVRSKIDVERSGKRTRCRSPPALPPPLDWLQNIIGRQCNNHPPRADTP